MLIYAVDLGTTNIKVALYDEQLRELAVAARAVKYVGSAPTREFDPERLLAEIVALMWECAERTTVPTGPEAATIVLTGQAESLVLADAQARPMRRAISWLDSRSTMEAAELNAHFGPGHAFAVTGQPTATPAWPAAQLRWLLKNEPKVLERSAYVLMLKDFMLLRLTGQAAGELSTRAFTYLFDVQRAEYWSDMVEFCGVRPDQLPDLVAPGATIGSVLPAVAATLPPASTWSVNVGALDHFASMIGSDSYHVGRVSESAGTVLSLSVLLDRWDFDPAVRVSYHRGIRHDEIVLFDCCDSGAICLDWFVSSFHPGLRTSTLDAALSGSPRAPHGPLFLPQITGVNPPEFFVNAHAAFIDLSLSTDATDLAYAVMEGVAHLLRSNLQYCELVVGSITKVVSAGGGTTSRFWTQLKADICNVHIAVPRVREVACRGAAVLGLVSAGILSEFSEAAELAPLATEDFVPKHTAGHDSRYARYRSALRRLYN